jgi:hypothetical protein
MPIFSVSPLDPDYITGIVPLGNLNPPSHTFPTDHIYFHITRSEGADRPDIATLYSPGELTITRVSASEHVEAGFIDYNIFLKPCKDITVIFYHASSLSEDIFGYTSPSTGWILDSEYSTGGETYRLWSKDYNIKVTAGEIIGTAGGNPAMQAPWSVIGVPSISLPFALSQSGLPLAIQLAGPPQAEDHLLAVARWCEKALNVHLQPPLD